MANCTYMFFLHLSALTRHRESYQAHQESSVTQATDLGHKLYLQGGHTDGDLWCFFLSMYWLTIWPDWFHCRMFPLTSEPQFPNLLSNALT